MKNKEIAEIFSKIGDILEFKGENTFRINAYRNAARVIEGLSDNIEKLREEGRLKEIQGIGEGMAKKIEEYLTTGKMTKYEEVRKDVPLDLLSLLDVQGIGPKTLSIAYKELNVSNTRDLERVIESGEILSLPGMGEKKLENIKRGLALFKQAKERISLGVAYQLVEKIIEELKETTKIKKIYPAGSLRRMKETIGDIDILVASNRGEKIIKSFTRLKGVYRILASGETKGSVLFDSSGLTRSLLQVDLRVVPENSFGSALQYFTGSKAHNIRLRGIAKEKGLKLSEYGVFKGDKFIAGKREEEVYESLDLSFIPPELREDEGEIECAIKDKLPELLVDEDIKGDLHIHSNYSDGITEIEEIATEAIKRGYEYIAITDHTQSATYAKGITPERLLSQGDKIQQINKKIKNRFKILWSSEVDIKSDGSLDVPDEILKKLDIVVAAIHSGFKQRVTERIIKAMENPYVDVIAHPTGRLISRREGYEIDLDKILSKAKDTKTALELNAYYDRLDLNDRNCRTAKEFGVLISIGTDSHNLAQLWMMRLGVGTARRGWLSKKDILNCYPVSRLRKSTRK